MSEQHLTLQQLVDSGQYLHAISLLEKELDKKPSDDKALRMTLATVRARTGQLEQAIEELEALVESTDFAPGWINLGQLYRVSGKVDKAMTALEKGLMLSPNDSIALKGLAEVCQSIGDMNKAGQYWQQLYAQMPDSFSVRQGMLESLARFSPAEAVTHGEWCLARQPENPRVLLFLAEANRFATRPELAMPLYRKLAEYPEYKQQGRMGGLLCCLELGYLDEVLARIEKIEGEQANLEVGLALLRARVLNEKGQQGKAVALSHELAAAYPEHPEALYALMNIDPDNVGDALLQRSEKLAEKLRGHDLGRLSFGIAACYEKKKNLDKQFLWLDKGNGAIRETRKFDRASHDFRHDSVCKVCDGAWVRQFSPQTALQRQCRPLLICGMPRSGTTLTEQVLGAHSNVFPTGESRTFNFGIQALIERKGESHLRRVLEGLTSGDLAIFAERAWLALREHDGCSGDVFTNKSMDTPLYLGLILAAFPDARVIHVQRHPLDLGFGCYKQLFTHGQAFSFDWDSIAYCTVAFEALMSHWKSVFPEKILTIRYENLVSQPENISRKLADHCGIAWQDAMLKFNENTNAVRTASVNQVRQGLFTHSVNRWERFGSRLDLLKDALSRYGLDYRTYGNESV
tara:strand:+ start:1638 stop:3530 length:1893 start_codon:yes stop_codon:yes gene_type:complete